MFKYNYNTVIIGNHDRMIMRKAQTSAIPKKWIKNYKDEGLEGLTGGITGARESKLSPSQKELLKSWVTEKTDPMGKPTAWTLEKLKLVIKEQFNVDMSIMPLWTLLKNMNCQTENSHSNDSVSVAAS